MLAPRTDDCRGRQRWTLFVDTHRFAMTKRPSRVASPISSQIPSPRYSWTIHVLRRVVILTSARLPLVINHNSIHSQLSSSRRRRVINRTPKFPPSHFIAVITSNLVSAGATALEELAKSSVKVRQESDEHEAREGVLGFL